VSIVWEVNADSGSINMTHNLCRLVYIKDELWKYIPRQS
jgi:hypothetical protein